MKETKPLVRDLMRTQVSTLSVDDTIETALALFEESGISGAPVLSDGELVGVLTLADVSRPEHRRDGRITSERDYEMSEPVGEERRDELDPADVFYLKEDYSPGVLGRELVGDWMTSGAISVAPSATLQGACEAMVRHHVHRVCVTEEGLLVGLITSFDVVRHVAGAPLRAARPHAAEGSTRSRRARK